MHQDFTEESSWIHNNQPCNQSYRLGKNQLIVPASLYTSTYPSPQHA